MKVAIWANSPSPHQSDFYEALRHKGVDLRVLYSEPLRQSRVKMGWQHEEILPPGEEILSEYQYFQDRLHDWKSRIHVIPGYSRRRYLSLARKLSSAGVPWVHWSENSQQSWRSAFTWVLKRWYARLVNQHALGAFAQGNTAEKDFLKWGIEQEKIAYLYYAIQGVSEENESDKETESFVRDKKITFVFVGSIYFGKAYDVLLRSFAAAKGVRRDVGLVMVGDGPEMAQSKRLMESLGIQKQVLLRGVIPMSELGSVICCCNSLVLPSRYDGWGVVLNEGASAGLALVGSNSAGASYHLIRPGINGFRVQAGSCSSLTAALRSYIHEPSLADEHGKCSRQLFEEFTPGSNAKRFRASIYSWLAGDTRWEALRSQWANNAPQLNSDAAA